MYDWIVVALGLSTTQLNSTRLSGSGAGPLGYREEEIGYREERVYFGAPYMRGNH